MEETLRVIKEMKRDGIIKNYAIGGAVGAIFYTEPFDTKDLDIFVFLARPHKELIVLSDIYEYLLERGHRPEGQFIWVHGVRVDFLVPYNRLTEEAVEKAVIRRYGGTTTRLMRPEYLIAIALQTGRRKDFARIEKLMEQADIDGHALQDILHRHRLESKWKKEFA